jgi:hypothetical protein
METHASGIGTSIGTGTGSSTVIDTSIGTDNTGADKRRLRHKLIYMEMHRYRHRQRQRQRQRQNLEVGYVLLLALVVRHIGRATPTRLMCVLCVLCVKEIHCVCVAAMFGAMQGLQLLFCCAVPDILV